MIPQQPIEAELRAPFLLLPKGKFHLPVPLTFFQVPGLQVHGLAARDLWVRDFMPVQTGPDRFVWFRYDPDYLRGFSRLRTPRKRVLDQLPWLRERAADGRCRTSDLKVDGGNVVGRAGRYLMVDKVLKENQGSRAALLRSLEEALQATEIRLLPCQRGDVLGHADGAVRWLDEDTVLVSDFREADPGYDAKLMRCLEGLCIERFPYREVPALLDPDDGAIAPATGCYLNFLEVAGHIFLPQFGLAEDGEALVRARSLYPRHEIVPVPCLELSLEGGVLNCISWSVERNE